MGESSDGTTLETAVLNIHGEMVHYRCPQYGTRKKSLDDRYFWHRQDVITSGATGPAHFYQHTPVILMALVPRHYNTILQCHFSNPTGWQAVTGVLSPGQFACVYANSFALENATHVLVRNLYGLRNMVNEGEGWSAAQSALPESLNQIRHTPYHKVLPTNPVSVISQTHNGVGHSPNSEAIVFHACGPGHQDAWMVLHWTFLSGPQQWVVSSVVLPFVIGMPL